MVPEIDIAAAAALLAAQGAVFVDIRDPRSFAEAHIPGAVQATPENIERLLQNTAPDTQIVVYCYHGNSSRPATQWFHQQGFSGARSMSGGFESWRLAASNDARFGMSSD